MEPGFLLAQERVISNIIATMQQSENKIQSSEVRSSGGGGMVVVGVGSGHVDLKKSMIKVRS